MKYGLNFTKNNGQIFCSKAECQVKKNDIRDKTIFKVDRVRNVTEIKYITRHQTWWYRGLPGKLPADKLRLVHTV